MSRYGYITNPDYQVKENEVTWNFQKLGIFGDIVDFKGIECFNDSQVSTSDFTIIGDNIKFLEWLYEFGEVPTNI